MAQYPVSKEERGFLLSASFLRLAFLTVVGGVINGLFLANYGFKQSGNTLTVGTNWLFVVCWFIFYPLIWLAVSQHFLPTKLLASVIDLNVATLIVLLATYIQNGMPSLDWPLALLYGLILVYEGGLIGLAAPSLFGLGSSGDSFFYSSFLLKGKTISDVQKTYSDPQYVEWLGFTPARPKSKKSRQTTEPKFFSLQTQSDVRLPIYVFFTKHLDAILVQIISFEKGKYTIFRSRQSDYYGGQVERTVLNDLHAEPIPFVDPVEKNNAEFYVLRITRSSITAAKLRTRDKAIIFGGATLVVMVATVAMYVPDSLSKEGAFTLAVIIVLGVLAELSYKRIRVRASEFLRKWES